MKAFILFPIHLFDIKYLDNDYDYYLIEEDLYFGSKERIENFNKLKLVLHRASMRYYYDYLKKNKFNVKYIDYKTKNKYNFIKKYDECVCFDPTDHLLTEKLLKMKVELIETLNFMVTTDHLKKYHEKTSKNSRYFHKTFYQWQLKNFSYLKLSKSYDTLNRKSLSGNIEIPKLIYCKNKYIDEAKIYVNKHFKNNYGDVDEFIYPITHDEAKKWLKDFIENKLKSFGIYQDAIDDKDPFLFHSCLSSSINIGLLNPHDVVDEINKYYQKHKTQIKINNFEGYIRQIIGWREYERYIYLYAYDEMVNSNYFNNQRKLTKDWYEGTTGIEPIDLTIKWAFKYGYLHHIMRLMVMANFMNLCEINPNEAYKWFMEFAIDSYDWVMIGNVYSMGLYADGGLTMRKPYISSDNYIMQMSNFKKGSWNEIWNALYYHFLDKHEKKIEKTVYARNLFHWKKRKDQSKILNIARNTINKITIKNDV